MFGQQRVTMIVLIAATGIAARTKVKTNSYSQPLRGLFSLELAPPVSVSIKCPDIIST
jgi:hypothetical protein